MLSYNQAPFISEALCSAFAQTYRPLEIIVSDDCSQDDSKQRISDLTSECPADIALVVRLGSENRGLASNLNHAFQLAKGEFILTASCDDVQAPERVAETVGAFVEDPRIMGLYSDAAMIDRQGYYRGYNWGARQKAGLYDIEDILNGQCGFLGASSAFRKNVLSIFGPISEDVVNEDLVLPFRAALLGYVSYVAAPLVRYRLHENNLGLGSYATASKRDIIYKTRRSHSRLHAAYRQRLSDLEVFEKSGVNFAASAKMFRKRLEDAVYEWEVNRRLDATAGWRRGLMVVRLILDCRLRFRARLRMMLLYGFPDVYLAWARRAAARNGDTIA